MKFFPSSIRLIVTATIAAVVGLVAGFLWQHEPVKGPSVIANERTLSGDSLASGSAADATERFLAALQLRADPLRMQRELWLAVQSLGPEQVRVLSADWGGILAVVERFKSVPMDIQQQAFVAIVERWLAVDPQGAMDRLRDIYTHLKPEEKWPAALVELLARKQPLEMFAFILAAKNPERQRELAHSAVSAWAVENRRLADEVIERMPEQIRGRLRESATVERATVDPDAGLLAARDEKSEKVREKILTGAASALAKRGGGAVEDALSANPNWTSKERTPFLRILSEESPRAAAELLAKSEPGRFVPFAVRRAAWNFATYDSDAALRWCEQLSGNERAIAEDTIWSYVGHSHPEAALAAMSANPRKSAEISEDMTWKDPRAHVLLGWLSADEPAARAWLAQNKNVSDGVNAAYIFHLTSAGRGEEAMDLFAKTNPTHQWARWPVTNYALERDARAAADWVSTIPAGENQNYALRKIVPKYASEAPDEAQQWIAGFPTGDARDNAARALVGALSQKQPEVARAWFDQIVNPWQRTKAAQAHFEIWSRQDRAAAEAWLRAVPNIYDSQRREMLRK